MFGILFKQKNSVKKCYEVIAEDLFSCALENTRREIFYTKYGVSDSFDGRFDLLLLHIFLILHRIIDQDAYEQLSQALFDVTFKDMDQTLREMGVGDMGVPKHMKRMMKAFNGRMYNYQMALAPETLEGYEVEGLTNVSLEEVLARNLYGMKLGDERLDKGAIENMCAFVHANIKLNDEEDIGRLMSGQVRFTNCIPNIGGSNDVR